MTLLLMECGSRFGRESGKVRTGCSADTKLRLGGERVWSSAFISRAAARNERTNHTEESLMFRGFCFDVGNGSLGVSTQILKSLSESGLFWFWLASRT